jgi:HNH endonuclease
MTSWIVTIKGGMGHHWDRAVEHGLWDVGRRRSIKSGDRVYFWLSTTGFVGRAEATSDLAPLSADHGPWDDAGQGRYLFRFRLRALPSTHIRNVEWKRDVKANTSVRAELHSAPLRVDSATDQRWLEQLFGEATPDRFWSDLAAEYGIPASMGVLEIDEDHDERRRAEVRLALRRGQPRFRRDLLRAYHGTCAVTGSTVEAVLEAAHIAPYRGEHTHDVRNGLLLRSDIHTLFDSYLLTVTPQLQVAVSPLLSGSTYESLDRAELRALPRGRVDQPNAALLQRHNAKCPWYGVLT